MKVTKLTPKPRDFTPHLFDFYLGMRQALEKEAARLVPSGKVKEVKRERV